MTLDAAKPNNYSKSLKAPAVDYDRLTKSYLYEQVRRIASTLERGESRSLPVSTGSTILHEGDLPVGKGRRINASILCLDIHDFYNRSAETEAEQDDLLRILRLFFSSAIKTIEDYGGVVAKNASDGLTAYFTSQSPSGVKMQKAAVAASLSIFAITDWVINPKISELGHPKLDLRICIDHGYVTLADVGTNRRPSGMVIVGSTANVASEMVQFAEKNTLLLGDQVVRGLPQEWQQYQKVKTTDTGWIYRKGGMPYTFWEYTGRWSQPT